MQFHQTELDNGLNVIAEINPAVQSVAFGFYVRTGARDETAEVSGVSHFLEHMVFKGTEKYSADDVNRIFDEIGARYNASTSEEVTLFYAAILPEYLPQTFELLSSILYPTLQDDDFEMEKKVILEEIGMYDDQPGFTAYETAMQAHFAGHPLGRSILGSQESITALTAEQMREYHREHYQAGNITLAVAGNTDWERIVSLANQFCSQWPAGKLNRPTDEANPKFCVHTLTKEGSVQEHVIQLAKAPPADDDLRYAAEILAVIVGDDSGSRMYWELVDPGYAEAAELGYNEYEGSGTYLTYLSCAPDDVTDLLSRINKIYAEVNQKGVTEAELEQAKNKVASRVVLRSERPMGRLASLGSNWVYRQEYCSVQHDLNTLQALSTKNIQELLEQYPLAQTSTAAVGPLDKLVIN